MEGPGASKGRQMKSHTQIKLFNCEELLIWSQYTKPSNICIWKKCDALPTEAWEVFSVYFFLLVFLLEKQVVTTLRF